MVALSHFSGNLLKTYPDPFGPVPRSGLGSELNQVRIDSSTSNQLCRISVRPFPRPGETHPRGLALPDSENKDPHGPGNLLRQAVHVPDRALDSHRKAGHFGMSSYEGHSVAPQKSLACPCFCPDLSIFICCGG